MWRTLRRRASLATLIVYEWVLARVGRMPEYGVLVLEIVGELSEDGNDGPLPPWLKSPPKDYLSLLGVLRSAREDDSLRGLSIRLGPVDASWARIQGLRRSLLALREAGKKVWVHLDSAGLPEYYLASAADRISLTPAGSLDVVGLSSEAMFFHDALQSLGVEAEVVHVGAYKAAGEMFTRTSMSEEHREMMESLIDDLFGQIVDGIAGERGIGVDALRDAIDDGPFLASEALQSRLIDAIEYADQAESALEEELGGAARIEEGDYSVRRARVMRRQALRAAPHHMAVVHVNGSIKQEEGPSSPLSRGRGATSAALKKSLEQIRERDDIEAIVLRVSSPGGSGLASDLIWHELKRTAEDKPLVVSFGDVAASGGYYVAMPGRKVFAEAGSVTGSIGVVAGKAMLKGLYDKVGVQKQTVSRGAHAALYSDYLPLGDSERERIQAEANKFYDDFVAKVAEGRKMSTSEVDAVAQGRVWTGRQAWSRGLVDELGGFEEAFDEAKRAVGLEAGTAVTIERFPKPQSFWRTALGRRLGGQSRLLDPASLMPDWLSVMVGERVWAMLPFDLRIR